MDLAERVVLANEQDVVEKQIGDAAPDGYYTDDLGLWVEQDIRKHKVKFAQYVLFRCLRLNDHMYVMGDNMLLNRHVIVKDSPADIASLADLPETITAATAKWVYKRLVYSASRLNPNMIEVVPGLVWDVSKLELVNIDKDEYKTVG